MPLITRGTAYVLFAFEVGQFIDLAACERLIPALGRQSLHHPRRAPQSFHYRPAPLRMSQEAEPVKVGAVQTFPQVEIMLYDFGCLLVSFALPLEGPVAGLVDLSCALQGNSELLRVARQRAAGMVASIRSAVLRPEIPDIVEDYTIYHIQAFEHGTAPLAVADHRQLLAQVLRAERETLSPQEMDDAIGSSLSFSERDITIIDWNAAIVMDPEIEETRTVLEFANAQLLEMRFLDQQLDEALEHAYQSLASKGWRRRWPGPSFEKDLQHLSTLQADAAVLFERVTNAFKLVGDMYLGRLYRLVSQRFHLAEWDNSISRKLQTIEGIYQKLSDRSAGRRLEVLEWIVILLIAFEILLTLVGH